LIERGSLPPEPRRGAYRRQAPRWQGRGNRKPPCPHLVANGPAARARGLPSRPL